MGAIVKISAFRLLVVVLSFWSASALAAVDAKEKTKTLTWAGCSISKTAFMSEMAEAYEKKTGVKIDLKGGGATKGIRQVSSREVTIGGTCRHIMEDARTNMTIHEERRVQLTPVAWDALVVIVHKDNPVKALTWKQLKAINTGAVKNWKEVGGPNMPVKVVTSHEGSATRLFFQKLVMENAPYTPHATTVWTTEKEIMEVSMDKGAIGAVSVTFHAKAPRDTIRINTDRIVRPLGLITWGKPTLQAQKVIDFFTIGEGHKFTQGAGK